MHTFYKNLIYSVQAVRHTMSRLWTAVAFISILSLALSVVQHKDTSCPKDTFQCLDFSSYYGHLDDYASDEGYNYNNGAYGYSSFSGDDDKYISADDLYHNGPGYYDVYTGSEHECISPGRVCDGTPDCLDCSDELNCTDPRVFFCLTIDSSSCVPIHNVCDNKTDCVTSGLDECNCPGAISCKYEGDEKCVSQAQICDGTSDCSAGEDESNCSTFQCVGNNKSVVTSLLCNGVNDCDDFKGSDECNCSTTFICSNGKCIHEREKCDGKADCSNAEDECDCKKFPTFRCHRSNKCIPAYKRCDGSLDCGSFALYFNTSFPMYAQDCSDELLENCDKFFLCEDAYELSDRMNKISCYSNEMKCDGTAQCNDGSDECGCKDSISCPAVDSTLFSKSGQPEMLTSEKCLLRHSVCDGKYDCPGGRDEQTIGFGMKCKLKRGSNFGKCIIPQYLVNDGIEDCVHGEDECIQKDGKDKCFKCLDDSVVISNTQMCDGVIDCPNFIDECLCDVKSRRLPLCDAFCDQHNLDEECKSGLIKCGSFDINKPDDHASQYLPLSKICDGFTDCSDVIAEELVHIDEDYCNRERHHHASKYKCPGGRKNSQMNPLYAKRCDFRPECADLSDECLDCKQRPLYCSNVSEVIALRGMKRFHCPNSSENELAFSGLRGSKVCDGKIDCKNDGVDEEFCPHRYLCQVDNDTISIDETHVCDGEIHCLNQSDEIKCDNYFYCESGYPLFVLRSVMFDGNADCDDMSDECPKDQLGSTFASTTKMIANPVFEVLVWIMAIVSLIGNLGVAVRQVINLFAKAHLKNKVAMCNHVLVLNLAIADFLTGCYLLMLGIQSIRFNGIYCEEDKIWRTSTTCSNLGFLNSIATEASVLILMIMTAFRLYTVYKPFETSRLKPITMELICLFGWAMVIVCMLPPRLPRFKNYFSNTIYLPGIPFFDTDIISREKILTALNRYQLLTNNFTLKGDKQWEKLRQYSLDHGYGDLKIFGYYSTHSVCMPNMLASPNSPGVEYSATITIFNLISFIFVVVSYFLIYRHAVGAGNKIASSRNTRSVQNESSKSKSDRRCAGTRSTAMQRKIFRLVASNLACWVPVSIMANLKLLGVQLSIEAYAVAAIVLLPINSALNPLVYSNLIDIIRSWFELLRKKNAKSLQSGSLNSTYNHRCGNNVTVNTTIRD